MVTCSAPKVLMAWCFSTRASVATGMNTHPCVVSGMTHGSRVTPYVDVGLGKHCFRYRLVAYSTPSLPRTNADLFLIGPIGTNFAEIWIKGHLYFFRENAFENVVCKMPGVLFWTPMCSSTWWIIEAGVYALLINSYVEMTCRCHNVFTIPLYVDQNVIIQHG